jgi:hypothetical protein
MQETSFYIAIKSCCYVVIIAHSLLLYYYLETNDESELRNLHGLQSLDAPDVVLRLSDDDVNLVHKNSFLSHHQNKQ